MNKQLQDLVRISNTLGSDSSLVQGGGGNTSVKTDDGKYMYIKASGTALKDMNTKRGWRRLKKDAVLDILADKSLAKMNVNARELTMVKRLLAACDDNVRQNVRPSVECPMHAVLEKCVIHLHAITAQAYTSAKNGKAEMLRLFKNEPTPPLWVPYANPGFELGHKVFSLVDGYVKKHGRKPGVLFMEKHGPIVTADSAEGALRLVRKVIRQCRAGLGKAKSVNKPAVSKKQIEQCKENIGKGLWEITGELKEVSFFTNRTIRQFLSEENPGQMLRCGVLTPDELAFLNGAILWLSNGKYETVEAKIVKTLRTDQSRPTAFVIENVGLFIAAEAALVPVARDVAVGSLFIRRNARNMGGINALTGRQRDFIKNWEAEQFRVQLAASGG